MDREHASQRSQYGPVPRALTEVVAFELGKETHMREGHAAARAIFHDIKNQIGARPFRAVPSETEIVLHHVPDDLPAWNQFRDQHAAAVNVLVSMIENFANLVGASVDGRGPPAPWIHNRGESLRRRALDHEASSVVGTDIGQEILHGLYDRLQLSRRRTAPCGVGRSGVAMN